MKKALFLSMAAVVITIAACKEKPKNLLTPIDCTNINLCTDEYSNEYYYNNQELNEYERNLKSHYTRRVSFNAQELQEWLNDKMSGTDKPDEFKIEFGIYTSEFKRAMGDNPRIEVGKLTSFIVPYKNGVLWHSQGSSVKDCFNLGSIDPNPPALGKAIKDSTKK